MYLCVSANIKFVLHGVSPLFNRGGVLTNPGFVCPPDYEIKVLQAASFIADTCTSSTPESKRTGT